MATPITPVILSGGSGSRLWPVSRKLRPKQFLPLISEDRTLFQSTLERLDGIVDKQPSVIVCNEEHRFMVAEQMQAIGQENQGILLEPVGRNTAPAVAVAMYVCMHGGGRAADDKHRHFLSQRQLKPRVITRGDGLWAGAILGDYCSGPMKSQPAAYLTLGS